MQSYGTMGLNATGQEGRERGNAAIAIAILQLSFLGRLTQQDNPGKDFLPYQPGRLLQFPTPVSVLVPDVQTSNCLPTYRTRLSILSASGVGNCSNAAMQQSQSQYCN
jgi:hypothetical protein